jgi:hypothetical protein
MCDPNNNDCSDCSDCCSECDFDDYSDNGTDTTFGSDGDYMDDEMGANTREAIDTREMPKIQDKKENCGHYISGCKIIAKCCNKEFGCRICHDFETSDHEINRYEIEEIICNNCKVKQPVSNSCINKECSIFEGNFASYYCDICHLYSDKPKSEIYHCEKCKICRMCGVGKKPSDFFHCDKCGGCINKELEETHKCVRDALRNDCCICLDNIFLSREAVVVLPCGHAIHNTCFNSSIKQNKYTCPLCRKIMIKGDALDMMNHQYDNIISLYPYDENIRAEISCNDCEFKGEVHFHPVGLKCGGCGGYNTVKR